MKVELHLLECRVSVTGICLIFVERLLPLHLHDVNLQMNS